MNDYTAIINHEESNSISVCFYNERDKIMTIGDKMNAINDLAYMNGYNWAAFINFYLKEYEPDVLNGMGNDPEAGMYAAYYELNPANSARAEKLVSIIISLVENEEKIYKIVKEHGDKIEWD